MGSQTLKISHLITPLATRRGRCTRGVLPRRQTKTVASPDRGAEPPRAMRPGGTQGETMRSTTSTASRASAAARLAEARYHAKYAPAKVVVVADYRIPEPSAEREEAPEDAPREALDVEPVPRHPRPSSSWRNISRCVVAVPRFPRSRSQSPPPTPRAGRRCCFFLTRLHASPPLSSRHRQGAHGARVG